MRTEREWLDSLKVGDEVAVIKNNYTDAPVQIQAVMNVTAHYITVGTRKFRRKDGYEPGDGYFKAYISQPTDELRLKARRAWLLARITPDYIKLLSNEQLERILAIIQEPERIERGILPGEEG